MIEYEDDLEKIEFECKSTTQLMCPYCFSEQVVDEAPPETGEEWDCSNCGETFIVDLTEYEVHYTTRRVYCHEKGEEHEYVDDCETLGSYWYKCVKCGEETHEEKQKT